MRPPPPWLRERTPEERARERDHLRQMQERERDAIACGFKVRPAQPKQETEK
jgi:hypothetical protein